MSHGSGTARVAGWILAPIVVLALAAAAMFGVRWWQDVVRPDAIVGEELTSFPEVDRSGLSGAQVALVDVLAREFATPRSGPGYAEGVREAWCADFVSWVMRDAGAPLSNPHSGSWRIPGVYTLREYYEAAGRFEAGGSYRPGFGDVVLYDHGSPFGQHTNIVVAFDGDTVTTIGGNEGDRVRIHRFPLSGAPGVSGFGRFRE